MLYAGRDYCASLSSAPAASKVGRVGGKVNDVTSVPPSLSVARAQTNFVRVSARLSPLNLSRRLFSLALRPVDSGSTSCIATRPNRRLEGGVGVRSYLITPERVIARDRGNVGRGAQVALQHVRITLNTFASVEVDLSRSLFLFCRSSMIALRYFSNVSLRARLIWHLHCLYSRR